ncbi:N-acetylneuraminate synthase family protein [Candidatus Nitrosotenuis chungbukensis]|uniref:N-acetylneuraminate synthase family protein n=1 Tax=Candidatus Nitrosotenuis chungbukensis TaxID=1353246 RepID=UPI0005B27646|nr:N-acetylneuraminate synthase family protein [Candidatus Nitrosotenuis chungbukensis]
MDFFQGNTDKIFVIAEAGSNWKCGTYEEDLKQALKLIQIASDCGANAVKFQTFRSETTYVHNAGKSDYLDKKGISVEINELFENNAMPYEMIPELYNYAKKKNILFMSTPFSVRDAKEINPYVSIHKVASYEINHVRLLEYLLQTNKPVIVSTGASTYDDIDFAVNILKNSKSSVSLLQCTSCYPCPIEALNLSTIPKIKSRYNLPVGLSDHSIDPIVAPLTAIGLGATIIEKHFTIDKTLSGLDHMFALSPDELKLMISTIRKAELAKGHGEKIILPEELELKQFATRSLQALTNIQKGDLLVEGINFDVLRPGNRVRGLDARFLQNVNGKKSKENVLKGDGIIHFE